ncbi:MAG: hypothetical protein DWQ45_04685 [Planctomycetota bacterium]|nr:MAG: hypothetical protein DWQ45_04685 [Planctomycetota bacterium]
MDESERILVGLCGVFVLGTAAQWMAWRLRLPSILLLLVCGFVAGPVTDLLRPQEIFGDLLFPAVSAAVAVILFEGSLSLRLREFREVGRPLLMLLTVGAGVTWLLTTLLARGVLGMDWSVSLLLGALLVVTGPTVVGPLLHQIRPVGTVGPLARWEGIIIDPIGAVLAVLVFEASFDVSAQGVELAAWIAGMNLLKTVIGGVLIGTAAGGALAWLLKRHLLADHLEAPVAFTLVLAAFAASNHFQQESGLVAVTVMGFVLANFPNAPLRGILEFKENLRVLLISTLFILLTARLRLSQFSDVGWAGGVFAGLLIVVVRPVSVMLATIGSELSLKERVFLSWLAPRGIVAAAVASVFALRMGSEGTRFVPAVFIVIAATVVVYGLTSFPLAKWLGLATSDPQGLLIAGTNPFARAVAAVLQEKGFRVALLDTNRGNVMTARLNGLDAEIVDVLSESDRRRIDFGGLGRFLAMTPNDEVNSLAALHFQSVFGRAHVYQLSPSAGRSTGGEEAGEGRRQARRLFNADATYGSLQSRMARGETVKATRLTEEFDYDAFQDYYGEEMTPLFVCEGKRLSVVSDDAPVSAKPGQTVVALVREVKEGEGESAS